MLHRVDAVSPSAGTIHTFIDLTTCGLAASPIQDRIAKWTHPENLGAIAGRVRIAVAPRAFRQLSIPDRAGWTAVETEAPLAQLNQSLEAAGRAGAALLLLVGPVDVNCDAVGALRQRVDRDPMYGFAVARIRCLDGCCLLSLSRHGVGPSEWLPSRVMAELPEAEILPALVGPCLLIAPDVVGNFGPLDPGFDTVAGAMLHYIAAARRCGFRTALANRAVVRMDTLSCGTGTRTPLAVSAADDEKLRQMVPDLDRAWQEFRGESLERFERLQGSVPRTLSTSDRPSLLLDVRNVDALYNGTTHAVLGTVEGFRQLEPDWDVTILANPRGAAFHDLERLYQGWPVLTRLPDRVFTVALRPSQPWHLQEMVDLHGISLFNAYLMLDTISWDIVYRAPQHLEGNWQFLADFADALLFDSDFTRARFAERFPSARSVPSRVAHFSFDPAEYARRDIPESEPEDDFIFVIGNSLDHKDVWHTADTLASAFPFRRLVVLGPAPTTSPTVTALHSGSVPEIDVHRLYANARFVVFPSFYEGFGFPLITALAYGRTVLARRSALVEELAVRCVPRGRLVLYDRREDLVDLLGRLIHGESVPEYALGGGLTDAGPRTWRDVAREILEFLEPFVREPWRNRWLAREHTVRQLLSYRT